MNKRSVYAMRVLAMSAAVALASAAAYAQTTTPAANAAKPRMQLDANKDGVIDRAEAAKAPKLAGKFDQLDRNKDGKLDADERRQMREGMRHRRMGKDGHAGRGRMMAADTDKDGRISRAEAQAAQAKSAERFDWRNSMSCLFDSICTETRLGAVVSLLLVVFTSFTSDGQSVPNS